LWRVLQSASVVECGVSVDDAEPHRSSILSARTVPAAWSIVMEMRMLTFRRATRDDLPSIVKLLADDPLGVTREQYSLPLAASYYDAYAAIERDENNELVVVEDIAHEILGVLQITFIPSITYRGAWRALIEGVRVASHARSSGIGRQLLLWAIERAKARRCHMLQLTSDKARPDAIRFYESLGFVGSHEGMKLKL
jgi:ribosomal protein S18 acetylase RimI-like enzyme